MHEKLIQIKKKAVPIVDRLPYARKTLKPLYDIARRQYRKMKGREPVRPIENNAVDDLTVPQYYVNGHLVERYAEHQARIHNRKILYYQKELRGNYIESKDDPRLVAVYLPQFHKIPLNEVTWGKGFTEWTNVATATPGFVGQQQPILPADLGFYDLDRPQKIKDQIDLAKKYGIHGFMFYYYWFSGEKILNNPIETFLENKEWDFNFMICWANENWTKRWDGRDNEIIIGQKFEEDDPLKFIKDVAPILNDSRYMTIDGNRPILAVYRPSSISNIDEYAQIWRNYFKENFGKDLYLIVGNNHSDDDPRKYGFDALYDFSPGSVIWGGSASATANIKEEEYETRKLDPNFFGSIVDYRNIALNEKIDAVDRYDFPVYQAVLPHWDNHARKKGKHTHALINSTPEVYATWLDRVIRKAINKNKSPIVFLNAWNEWAEGAMLEPTNHLGHANLARTVEVLSKYSGNEKNAHTFPMYGLKRDPKTEIAVVIHLFYPELWETLTSQLDSVTKKFDIFVTVPEKHKNIKLTHKDNTVHVHVVPNWGRDVLPFLHVMRKIRSAGYEYVLKLHSKKSKQISTANANYWLKMTIGSLLFSKKSVNAVLKKLGEGVKIIGVKKFAVKMSVGGEPSFKPRIQKYYSSRIAKDIIKNIEKYTFSAGSMFWARADAFDDILERHLVADDFELEYGQLWDTLAHFLERDIWINIQNNHGKSALGYISDNGQYVSSTALKNVKLDLDFPELLNSFDKTRISDQEKKSKVSIIITNYNYGKYVAGAIKSALRQTYEDIEILVIDDGSSDKSQSVITKISKNNPNKVKGFMLPHAGVVPARNFSLDNVTGDFLLFLDADDLLPKDYVQKMVEEASYGHYDVVYADMHDFGADYKIQFMPEFNKSQMLQHNLVNMSALVRRSSIGELRFDSYLNKRKLEDWDFFLGLTLSGATFSKAHNTHLKYRIHAGQRNNNLHRDDKFWTEYHKTVKYIRDKYRKQYPNERIPN